MNDFLLILQMKQGNEKAFDKFVRKYYAEILSYCRYHCLDQAEAEDLTQETFLRFMENIASYQHIGKAKNYLYVIAGNLCKNYAKKWKAESLEQEILERVPRTGEKLTWLCFEFEIVDMDAARIDKVLVKKAGFGWRYS